MPVLKQADLPMSNIAREFVGADHGSSLTLVIVDAPPGRGPRLHSHPYEEIIVTQEGEATFRIGDDEVRVVAGDIVVVPPGTPHAFTNTGSGRLRQLDIHASPSFHTDWLE